jgi:nucleotide-binding universal stress UspA family protein
MATMPVVAAVDGSEESLLAAEWAAQEAQRRGAPLRLVSAVTMPPRMHARHADPRTVADELSDESARALSEAVTRSKEVSSGLLIDASVLPGPPALAVTASGSGALMLVVGARGAGGFAALLLGSVSRYAAMHAASPVVVVRQETNAVHGEIVVGIGDPLDATATLAFAFDEAAVRGASLVAVHCLTWNPAASWQPGGAERVVAQAEWNLAAALRPWQEKYPAVPVRSDMPHGHPARVLASYASRADLVVIGRHHHDTGPAIGGTQHALLSHAHGSIAIVPETAAVPDPVVPATIVSDTAFVPDPC